MFKINNNYSASEKASIYAKKHFKIDGQKSLPGDSSKELNEAKLMISNYARHKKVDVRFFDPRELLEYNQNVSPKIEHKFAKMVGLEVKKKTLFRTKTSQRIITYIGRKDASKPFIREVYEQLQDLCGDKSSLGKLISKTTSNLRRKRIIL